MIVVLNTTPLNYLLQIGQAEVLPQLYDRVLVPEAVQRELMDPRAPARVRNWAAVPPGWLEVCSVTVLLDLGLAALRPGEREAIALAEERKADLLLIDERAARGEAGRRGLTVTGNLGVLDTAAERGLLDLRETLGQLRQTSFRMSPALIRTFLAREALRVPLPSVESDPEMRPNRASDRDQQP